MYVGHQDARQIRRFLKQKIVIACDKDFVLVRQRAEPAIEFNVDRGEKIRRKWEQIPDDTDVLITHGPPHGILDMVSDMWSGKAEAVGCEELLPIVQRIKPRAHIFGHIHAGYGQLTQGGIQYVNASNCNEQYQLVHPPIVLDL